MTSTPTPKIIALAVAGVLALGGGTAAVAGAADDAPSAAKGPTPEKRAAAKAERQKAFAFALGVSVDDVQQARERVTKAYEQRREDREAARAKEQGVSVQELRDRRADRLEKRLEQAVDRGRLTQAQADGLVAAVRKGEPLRKVRKQIQDDRREQRQDRRADRKATQG